MNQYTKSLLIIATIQMGMLSLFSFSESHKNLDIFLGNLGVFYVLTMPVLFIAGLLCLFFEKTRAVGQALLTMTAVSLVFGIGLCSGGRFQL